VSSVRRSAQPGRGERVSADPVADGVVVIGTPILES